MAEAAHVDTPTTDPTYLFDLAEGMHVIEVLTASVGWLHLYEWLAANPADEKQICQALDLAPRPAHVLLTLLMSLGLVSRGDQGTYTLTQLAREYLLPGSPWSLVPCFDALKHRPPCFEMLAVLRTGKPLGAPEQNSDPPSWATGMDDEAFAEYFLNAIDSRNAYLAHAVAHQVDLKGCHRLLDVGGGSGIYACALARHNPDLHATVLEKIPVDAIARRAVNRRELADRVSVRSGDMLSGCLPEDYDVHLYSNVIHDWGEPAIRLLLRSSFDALPPGGLIVIHDALLDESGTGPRAVAEYSVLLMAFTAGRCYSVGEVRSLLEETGFVDIVHRRTVVHRSLVTASKPRDGAPK